MRADRVAPKITVVNDATTDYREEHPSYAMAVFSRVTSGGGEKLFGSPLSHTSYITLSIRRSEKNRHLNRDWYYAKQELIEVAFSANQFAELITNMNVGFGVPCTIQHIQGEQVPQCEETTKLDEVGKEFTEKVNEVVARPEQIIDEVRALFDSGSSFGKTKQKELLNKLEGLAREIRNNLPFVQTSFQEAVDKTVVCAKAELDSLYTHIVMQVGKEELAARISVPALENVGKKFLPSPEKK